jgi:phosphoribosyl-AMP cyclohydrolase
VTDPSDATGADPHGSTVPNVTPDIDDLRYDAAGLVPVVVQQHDTGEVLMVAWADRPALRRALEVGEAVFYSRSRREQWHKGATSGNTQRLLEVRVDCDADVVLYLVDQGHDGVACHTGARSCFHRRLAGAPAGPTSAAPPLAVPEERQT